MKDSEISGSFLEGGQGNILFFLLRMKLQLKKNYACGYFNDIELIFLRQFMESVTNIYFLEEKIAVGFLLCGLVEQIVKYLIDKNKIYF